MATDVLDQVRELLAEADAAGRRRPGRKRLVEATGARVNQVRRALDMIKAEREQATEPAPLPDGPDVPPAPTGRQVPARLVTHGVQVDQPGDQPDSQAGEPESAPPRLARPPRPWPLVLIALAAAASVWTGWTGLGQLAGFGMVKPLPGIWDDLRINTAVLLPISVEAYAAFALRCWLGGAALSARTRRFASRSAIASLVIGGGAQVAYHLMAAAHVRFAPWPVVVCVALVPVVTLGVATALARLVTSDHQDATSLHQTGGAR
jgi:hypothetical protein